MPIPTLRRIHFFGFMYRTSTLKYETSVRTLLLFVLAVLYTLLHIGSQECNIVVSAEEVSFCRTRSDCDMVEGKSVVACLRLFLPGSAGQNRI
jgi:hypothetical protein